MDKDQTRPRRGRWRRVVFHPPLVAAFPVLFLWAHNLNESVTWGDVWRWLFGVIAVAIVLWGLGTLLLHNPRTSALAVSFVALLFFSYGYVSHAVEDWHVAGVRIGAGRFLMPVWALIALAGIVLAVRGGTWVAGLTSGLNFVAAAMVALNVGTIVLFHVRSAPDSYAFVTQGEVKLPSGLVANPPRDRPDVYYIILEEYAGANTLRDQFGYDNAPFENFLSSNGFYVAPDSVTNYPRTELSVASSLNLRYLDFLTRRLGTDIGGTTPLVRMIQRPDAARIMQSLGYDYIQLGSWWKPTKESPTAEHNVTYGGLSEFSRLMFEATALTRFARDDFRTTSWKTTRFQFDQLTRLDRFRGPRFVFAHIICPHDPLVFGRDGRFLTDADEAKLSQPQNYVNQLAWVNHRVMQLVNDLLARPEDERPVIIIQSDEGPYSGEPTVWDEHPDEETAEQKFDILNAYYFPGVTSPDLYPTITPVNSFRVLLNTYFQANLPLLPDRAYTFADFHRHLFEFRDVTTLVQPLSRSSPEPSPSAAPP